MSMPVDTLFEAATINMAISQWGGPWNEFFSHGIPLWLINLLNGFEVSRETKKFLDSLNATRWEPLDKRYKVIVRLNRADLNRQKRRFLQRNKKYFKIASQFAHIGKKDFSLLDRGGAGSPANLLYLDYTGSMVPPDFLLDQNWMFFKNTLLANPHSMSQPSRVATECDVRARHGVLQFKFINADPEEYMLVWTEC